MCTTTACPRGRLVLAPGFPWSCSIVALGAQCRLCIFFSILFVCFGTRFLSMWGKNIKSVLLVSCQVGGVTWVSVSLSVFDSWHRFATDKYLLRSNSASRDFIWAAVKAVRGLFFRSSSDLLSEKVESAKNCSF